MTITDKIQSWCDRSISKLIDEYDSQGRRASGKFEEDLESNINRTLKGYNVQLLGPAHTFYMENGRKAGKFPPIAAIRKWIDDKGIVAQGITRDSLAFLIARKISREGYQGKPVVANAITDEWIQELLDTVGFYLLEDIKSDIIKNLKAA